ncbi:YbaY family lipoprotein [Providencia alcalifaciens]|uniref:YbaY family lipoprotein n=1 Tax=Providencia alcalifaciens TaxID=126385 RepID=UPI001CE103DA|nr:YbaY family lipoprotein [Providencia alcalifaciens]UBX50505.1 YbaY family lipoprotein [Providencia alcalifaciens]
MPRLTISKNILHFIFILACCLFLFSCNNPINQNRNGFNIQGDVYSQSIDIPNDALITISVTPINGNSYSEKSHYDYTLTTRKSTRTVNFSINLPESLLTQGHYFGLSVRVEKKGELLMMSNQVTPLNQSTPERLSLKVSAL